MSSVNNMKVQQKLLLSFMIFAIPLLMMTWFFTKSGSISFATKEIDGIH